MSVSYIDRCISDKRADLLFQEELALRSIISRMESSGGCGVPRFKENYISSKETLNRVVDAK